MPTNKYSGLRQVTISIKIRKYRDFKPWNMRCCNAIREFFNKKMIADEQSAFHRTTRDNKGLRDKKDDKQNDDNRSCPTV